MTLIAAASDAGQLPAAMLLKAVSFVQSVRDGNEERAALKSSLRPGPGELLESTSVISNRPWSQ